MKWLISSPILLVLGIVLAPSIAQADSLSTWTEFTGETSDQQLGKVAMLGDINADGYDDFAMAAPNDDTSGVDAGAVYLYYGSSTSLSGGSVSGGIKITGEAAGDHAGYSVAGIGDVNNDGYDDFAIGAPYNDDGGVDAGTIYLYYGRSALYTSMSLSGHRQMIGEYSGDLLGYNLAGAGDVNGDGYDDLLTTAISNEDGGYSGSVYLLYGNHRHIKAGNINRFREFTSASASGAVRALGSAGDINADGYKDILFGASGVDNVGTAYLLYGQSSKLTSSSLSTAITFTGVAWMSETGNAVTGVGDMNADGYDDFAISSSVAPTSALQSGAVYLFYGKADLYSSESVRTGIELAGEHDWDVAGRSLTALGDVNADGYADFMVSAIGNDTAGTNSGAVYVVMGGAAPLTASALTIYTQYTGEVAGDYAGIDLAGNGDVNGDGTPDVLVASVNNDDGGSNAGAVYLYYF